MAAIIFFGSSPLSNIVLEKLVNTDVCSVIGVVTKPDMPAGRGQKMVPNPVKVLAEKNGIKVFISIDELPIIPENAVSLVAAYGKIIPQNILDTFNGQIYNIHPSLLPKYRGASPLPQQILDGIVETGVTIIKLDKEMDHGPIVAQEKDKILPSDTWLTLGERLFDKGAELFITNLQQLSSSVPQDHSLATYTKLITRQDGFVDWKDFKPETLETKLRAYAQWPGVWTIMPDGKRLKLIATQPQILVQIEGKTPDVWVK